MNRPSLSSLTGFDDQEREVWPPCQVACPIHQDVQKYVALISQGRFDEALVVVKETNPLPSICGLVCVQQCQTMCRRGKVEQAISIRALKRAAVAYGSHSSPARVKAKSGEKVAIIGSGPAGLSAAFYLANLGYSTTIFEAQSLPGGMLRYGIPEYRLPNRVLDSDISHIEQLGVEIRTSSPVGGLKEVFGQGYKAIFLGIGAWASLKLGITGEDARGVLYAIDFLKRANSGQRVNLGNRVIVIGGGSVAIDAARLSRRLGAREVHLVCLETRELASKDRMLAEDLEIEEAEQEGVIIHPCLGPKEIVTSGGRVIGLETINCCSVRDDRGRFAPKFTEEPSPTIDTDTIIIAIGQRPREDAFPEVERGRGKTFKADSVTLETNIKGVFAGGDAVSGPAIIVKAMAAGRQAALSIDCYLRGEAIPGPAELIPVAELIAPAADRVKRLERQRVPTQPAARRISNLELVEQVYTKAVSIREAGRCLNCGLGATIVPDKCIACLTCVRICPYGAAAINRYGEVEIGLEQCIACGLCAAGCPARAIELQPPGLEVIESSLEAALKKATDEEGVILGLVCTYSNLMASLEEKNYPRVRLVKIPCVSRIATDHLLKAFELGAAGVFIAACTDGDCRYQDANYWVELKVAEVRRVLSQLGLDEERLRLFRLAPADIEGLDKLLAEFTSETRGLKPARAKRG